MPSIYINENDISGSDGLFISNIYSGKILGEIMRLQNKTVNIIENSETNVTFDTGYTGLSNVKIITNVVPETQTKSVTITQNGSTTVTPDENKYLSSVDVQVSVPNPSTGVINITENGFYDTMTKAGVIVNVPQGITPLSKTVTFKNGADNYQVVTVTDGQTVAQPPTNPTSPTALFSSWQKGGSAVAFPYTPVGDDTLDALFSNITANDIFQHYNIDQTESPYFFISYGDRQLIFFCSSYRFRDSFFGVYVEHGNEYNWGYYEPLTLSEVVNRTFSIFDSLPISDYGTDRSYGVYNTVLTNMPEAVNKFPTTYILT